MDRMRIDHIPAGTMVDARCEDCLEVLNERAVSPDVQGLHSVANRKYWLVEVERILEQEFIDRCASPIGRATRWNACFAVALGVDIEAASGKQHTLGARQQASHTVLALMQRNQDGDRANRLKSGEIGGKGTRIVGCVARSRLRNRDTD